MSLPKFQDSMSAHSIWKISPFSDGSSVIYSTILYSSPLPSTITEIWVRLHNGQSICTRIKETRARHLECTEFFSDRVQFSHPQRILSQSGTNVKNYPPGVVNLDKDWFRLDKGIMFISLPVDIGHKQPWYWPNSSETVQCQDQKI